MRPFVACLNHGVDDHLAADPLNRLFAGWVNIRDENCIRIVEGPPEVLFQSQSARVSVRLEHDEHPILPHPAGRCEGSADFAGVMPVIVDHHEIVAAVLHLETPTRTSEGLKSLGDLCDLYAQLYCKGNCPGGVADVVAARDVQGEHPQQLAVAEYLELGMEGFGQNRLEAVVGIPMLAKGDRVAPLGADS